VSRHVRPGHLRTPRHHRAGGLSLDELVVAVALSPDKGAVRSSLSRSDVRFIESATAHLPNVSVRPFDTLLVEFASEVGASVIIKGLRAVTDFEREFQMAQLNYRLSTDIETMFIMAIPSSCI
jgi:pantetheine-phosphate adenylyltransferase